MSVGTSSFQFVAGVVPIRTEIHNIHQHVD